MTVQLLPSGEQVAVAWISSIGGLQADGVATQLPDDETKWQPQGFVTVAVVGGSPDMYVPVRKPVFQIDTWAVKIGSSKPPWGKAASLCEQIRMACYNYRPNGTANRALGIRASGAVEYPPVRVMGAWLMTEPHRIYEDRGDFARYSFSMTLHWTTIQPVTVNG
jgi:hypothetical protein